MASHSLHGGADRAAEAKKSLDEAACKLGESAPLVVRGLAFSTEIQSYGCHTRFARDEFAPEQEVLLYAEVENFTSERTPKGCKVRDIEPRLVMPAPKPSTRKYKTAAQRATLTIIGWTEKEQKALDHRDAEIVCRRSLTPGAWALYVQENRKGKSK